MLLVVWLHELPCLTNSSAEPCVRKIGCTKLAVELLHCADVRFTRTIVTRSILEIRRLQSPGDSCITTNLLQCVQRLLAKSFRPLCLNVAVLAHEYYTNAPPRAGLNKHCTPNSKPGPGSSFAASAKGHRACGFRRGFRVLEFCDYALRIS